MSASNFLINSELKLKCEQVETKTIIATNIQSPPESNLNLSFQDLNLENLSVSNETSINGSLSYLPLIAPIVGQSLVAKNTSGELEYKTIEATIPNDLILNTLKVNNTLTIPTDAIIDGYLSCVDGSGNASWSPFPQNLNLNKLTADDVDINTSLKYKIPEASAGKYLQCTDNQGSAIWSTITGGVPNESFSGYSSSSYGMSLTNVNYTLSPYLKTYDPANVWTVNNSSPIYNNSFIRYTGTGGVFRVDYTFSIRKENTTTGIYMVYALQKNTTLLDGEYSSFASDGLISTSASGSSILTLANNDTIRIIVQSPTSSGSFGIYNSPLTAQTNKVLTLNIVRIA